MRWLDRWLGVPLCFLMSLAARLRGARASMAACSKLPRRVLCIQLAEMGSLVLTGPALHWLQAQGGQPFYVSFDRNRDALKLAGTAVAERCFLMRTESTLQFALDILRFIGWAWRNRLDASIDFEPCARISALLSLLSGAPVRAGFGYPGAYRGKLYNRSVAYDAQQHMMQNYFALVGSLYPGHRLPDVRLAEDAWRSSLPAFDTGHAAEKVAWVLNRHFAELPCTSLVLFNPNAGDLLPQRRWPEDRFVELAIRILERDASVFIGIIGAAVERQRVEGLAARVNSLRCASLAGDVSVDELPALFARSHLLVTNDSGPAHLASLSSTPTLVLFGPETPELYKPLGHVQVLYANLPCSPCISPANQRRSDCKDNQCMKRITVEEVACRINAMLDGSRDDRRAASADV